MTNLLLLLTSAYFVGAIPVGVLVARSKGIDILNFESGNPGATNVGRALGRTAGVFVFVADMLKGLLPTLAARFLLLTPQGGVEPQVQWAFVGVGAVLGHTFSPFLKFKGGKGISTSLGMVAGTAPLPALVALFVFGVLVALFRYISLASIVGTLVAVLSLFIFKENTLQLLPLFGSLFLLVVYLHRGNIKRLLNGTERKIGQKKTNENSGSAV